MVNKYQLFIIIIVCAIQCILTARLFSGDNRRKKNAIPIYISSIIYSILQMIAAFVKSYFAESFLQSLSTVFVILTVIFAFRFIYFEIIDDKKSIYARASLWGITITGVADIVMIMVNPFYEFVMSYTYNPAGSLRWSISKMLPYYCHLAFIHITVGIIIVIIIYRCLKMPALYSKGYIILCAFAVFCGLINIVAQIYELDEKILLLPILMGIFLFAFYRIFFMYMDGAMLDHVRFLAIEEYTNPVIMFNNKNQLILCNKEFRKLSERAIKFRKKEELDKYIRYGSYTLEDFRRDFFIEKKALEEDRFFNITFFEGKNVITFRADRSTKFDSHSRLVATTFILTDTTMEMDPLTGFQKRETFNKLYDTKQQVQITYPAGIIMIDIKGLKKYNDEHGKENGNRIIQLVAMNMQKYCPSGSFFWRGQEANLYALCQGVKESEIKDIISEICSAMGQDDKDRSVVRVRTTYGILNSEVQNPLQVADTITLNMKTKKMLEMGDEKSSILDFLIQMQTESDPLLSRHIKRTRYLSSLMAEKLSLSDYQSNNLTLLSLIHDIGNIGVPMEIVNKPGKLTSVEWEVMKTHVQKGYRMALASEEFKDIAICILHHHECFDGSGYPDGLSGESIPYLARIIAVIEAYDAMTNERPYRPPMSANEAKEELIKCKGKQYDPKIVDVFINLISEITPEQKNVQDNQKPESKKTAKSVPMSISESDAGEGYIDQVKHSVYLLDSADNIIEVDEAFEQITGYKKEDVERLKLNQKDLIFAADYDEYMKVVISRIEITGDVYLEHRIKCKDGSEKYIYCYGRRYYDNVARDGRSSIMITDISNSKKKAITDMIGVIGEGVSENLAEMIKNGTQIKELEEKEYLLNFNQGDDDLDSATGLMSKKFYDRLNERLFANKEENLLILVIDIDNFEGYSKLHGKGQAEDIIQYFASIFNQTVSNEGIAARVGLDEFACTLTFLNNDSKEQVDAKISEVWGSLMDLLNDRYRGVTISLGASFALVNNGSVRNYNKSWEYAKKALEQVKKEGRNGYKIL